MCSIDWMPLNRRDQRARRRARARLLQALYAWETGGRAPLPAVAQRLFDDLALGAAERAYAFPLVEAIAARRTEIDDALAHATTNWRLERLGVVERAVLRLATAELLLGVVPARVSLQEAVCLAERYGAPESARFVNGVLDAVARRLGSV
jgi:N utilization substance protein B